MTPQPVVTANLALVWSSESTVECRSWAVQQLFCVHARVVESPHIAIPHRLLQQLFPANPSLPPHAAPARNFSASAAVMRFEVDGIMQPKQSLVQLRTYSRGHPKAARVCGHGAYDLLKVQPAGRITG
ncbi:hypothetical protein HaLaN_12244 [Haematococcus lacustris]|uniref:Uncharacterized protein n=1 Tax=Haematococcus lacustris TaxID=44745 RepID=A0A699Z9X4_HAELA|nr:hypothetical protein HaLaN_12244 [Haematococcus lacustris]